MLLVPCRSPASSANPDPSIATSCTQTCPAAAVVGSTSVVSGGVDARIGVPAR
jgi:hypothetical protein